MSKQKAGKILVVDDEQDVFRIARVLLEKEGHAVETTQSCEEALRKAAAEELALIVLDMTRPGIDAPALCEGLAQTENVSKTPLLLVAENEEIAERLLGKLAAPGGYVTKPVEKGAFFEKVRNLIGETKSPGTIGR